MEKLTTKDIHFLIALTASEEGMLVEIVREFDKWICDKEEVLNILSSFVKDDSILIYKLENEETIDLSKEQSLSRINKWSSLDCEDHMFYLTKKGERRWETEDWGISTQRAHRLMFRTKSIEKNA